MVRRIRWFVISFLIFTSFGHTKERNLLKQFTNEDFLATVLAPGTFWVTYPDYQDRIGWDNVAGEFKDDFIKEGEKYLDFTWPTIPATAFLEFVRTGERMVMRVPYKERHKTLMALFWAEMMEGKGRFLDQIINGVWVYCEQTFWGESAHLKYQKAGSGLPDVNEPTIDLGAARIASSLAWIHYFLHDEFDKINPLISSRIKKEIKDKVLDPYYTRDDFWWLGYDWDYINNWNPICNYNTLLCILLLEQDKNKRITGVKKALNSVDQFINYYKDDGACEEGPDYWGMAGGTLYDFLELLYNVSNGKINIYKESIIANIGSYIYKVYISNPYFFNYSDAEVRIRTRAGVLYRYGKRIHDSKMMGLGAFLAQAYEKQDILKSSQFELTIEELLNLNELYNYPAKEPLIGEYWLPDTQIMGARDQEGTKKGFYFAVRGGHNAESHNHNDVGQFILYVDGNPCMIDPGVGTYTQKTFSPQRYEIWTMQSGYHNLPGINGMDQKSGREYAAKNCQFKKSKKEVTLSLDISKAYPKEAAVSSWIRSFQLERGKRFKISEKYELDDIIGPTTFNFMTCCNIEYQDQGEIILKGDNFTVLMSFENNKLDLSVESVILDDYYLNKAWPNGLSRLVFNLKEKSLKGTIDFIIEKM